MIQDEELRDLFRIESEEHLQKLDEGLLHLEKSPKDQPRLDEIFREAHSLKGAARMLGVEGVEQIAHLLEDRLGQAKRGDAQLDSDTIDRMYVALDAVRELVQEAVTGKPAKTDVVLVSDILSGRRPLVGSRRPVHGASGALDITPHGVELAMPQNAGAAAPQNAGAAAPQNAGAAAPQNAGAAAPQNAEAAITTGAAPLIRSEEYRIETIRINTEKLDSLLNQAGELTVAAQRVRRRPGDIEEISGFLEDWNRRNLSHRRLLGELEGDRADAPGRNTTNRLREYFTDERERLEKLSGMLDRLKQEATEDAAKLELIAGRLEDGIRDARMLPLSTLFGLFPRTIRDLSREEGKQVEFVVEGGETRADKRIVEEMKDPLMHILRNAVDHGIESPTEREEAGKSRSATLMLRGRSRGRNVEIEIRDDGRGLDVARIKATAIQRGAISAEHAAEMSAEQAYQMIFLPGFSTRTMITDVSGRGVGMDVVRNNVELLKGSIEVESNPGHGTVFTLILPTALTTTRVLLVQVAGQTFAVPTENVETTQMVERNSIFSMEGRTTVKIDEDLVSIARLALLLELPETAAPPGDGPAQRLAHAFVIRSGEDRLALIVDDLLDEQEIILKPSGGLLKRVRNVAGMTILESGTVCVVLNPRDLIRSELGRKVFVDSRSTDDRERDRTQKQTILLVEDSITTRMQERRILERAGFEVVVAVDGQEAYQKLTANPGKIDAIVSDVEMPNMDGFTFTARVRAHEEFRDLPVVLVTTLSSEEHRHKGMEAGANAYITKGGFNQAILLDTLRRLI